MADYDDLRLCNCVHCGCEIAARGQTALMAQLKLQHPGMVLPGVIAGRIDGRPYCRGCLWSSRSANNTANSRTRRQASKGEREGDGDNPYLDRATREHEENSSDT